MITETYISTTNKQKHDSTTKSPSSVAVITQIYRQHRLNL